MRGSARSGCSPQPPPPASTRSTPISSATSRQASTRRRRFLRGSSVPTPRTYGRAAGVGRAVGPVARLEPGRRDDEPVRGRARALRRHRPPCTPSSRRRRRTGARPRPCAGASRSSGACTTRGGGGGRGRGSSSPEGPRRCGGVIQSVKSRASKRPRSHSAGGNRAMLHAVRTACEAGSGQRRGRSPRPARRARIRPGPARLVGANGHDLVVPGGGAHEPRQRPPDVVADPGRRVRER